MTVTVNSNSNSSHFMLLDIKKLCSSTIYSEQILQRLSIHLERPLCCQKTLFSELNLVRVNKWSKFLGYFGEKITFFLGTSERCLDWIFDNLERIF